MSAVKAAIASAPAPRAFSGSRWEGAAAAAQQAPYLARLMKRRPDLIEAPDAEWPARLVREAIAAALGVAAEPPSIEAAMEVLRRAKDAVHLACALADLSRAWPLMRITGALTDFADASVRAALAVAAREIAGRAQIEPDRLTRAEAPSGFAIIGMGKMGAHELNYSSDIDISVFFDAERLEAIGARDPRVTAVRMVAPMVRVLEEITADGYVFRTDLRLRPDPGSTPVAVSIAAAEHYYQTLGQNWERAAFIKARAVAGDLEVGRQFLADLQPFIWRKHLDFAAVADVQSIKRQILSTHKRAELGSPVFDVKLGRGGIRDIELFVQTQQLILGGRNRALRTSRTLEGLEALEKAAIIGADARDALAQAYRFFRDIEHRVQMLEDAQTHKTPADKELRARVAALAGFETLADFDVALIEQRKIVAEIDQQLFGGGESLADPMGSLIFTGVEDHPETLRTISKLGYQEPARVSQTIRGWHHGRIRAMRSERSRELLTTLTPKLLRAFAETGDPDRAFSRFDVFFSSLSAGVQVLSLLQARPSLLDLLARLFAAAPRLASTLARRPALLDAIIEPHFAQPLNDDAPETRLEELRARLHDAKGFEAHLNEARRFQREEAFRIGVQVLEGAASAETAGAAHANLAEACVIAMSEAALAETERLFGPAPGAFAVFALGKFGGRELSEGADLDVMVVYDEAERTDFYTRFTQRLISALSAPTEEGVLYEVDTQLRPSGSSGPVAVQVSAFERYYEQEAWTWELLALTRLRPVAGDEALGEHVAAIARRVLALRRDAAKTLADVADMRARMERERSAKSIWDLKLAPGGFVDIEFVAQALQLVHANENPDILSPNTGEALARIADAEFLSPTDGGLLAGAWRRWSDLQQMLRICVEGDFDAATASPALKRKLAEAGRAASFETLEREIQAAQAGARAIFARLIPPV
ncbi:MAG: bifunctional [glutamine synthetase] adenylyltransferase/[glutamine synthetase]-adenylyl-L-tyrosine phosphorylase [Hyphomonadaceae bacterium]|nr:bifunctional [glutamine synthetase] adenylyltransferase/[glutamine synthetase]-adenylyl-L-tyrosine phosphorylase [Hyphomonadaceae bacterium]